MAIDAIVAVGSAIAEGVGAVGSAVGAGASAIGGGIADAIGGGLGALGAADTVGSAITAGGAMYGPSMAELGIGSVFADAAGGAAAAGIPASLADIALPANIASYAAPGAADLATGISSGLYSAAPAADAFGGASSIWSGVKNAGQVVSLLNGVSSLMGGQQPQSLGYGQQGSGVTGDPYYLDPSANYTSWNSTFQAPTNYATYGQGAEQNIFGGSQNTASTANPLDNTNVANNQQPNTNTNTQVASAGIVPNTGLPVQGQVGLPSYLSGGSLGTSGNTLPVSYLQAKKGGHIKRGALKMVADNG